MASDDIVGIVPFSDQQLADAISNVASTKSQLLVVVNSFTARVLYRGSEAEHWQDLGFGDFGQQSKSAIASSIKAHRVWWLQVETQPESVLLDEQEEPAQATTPILNAWLKRSEEVTDLSGRKGEATEKTRETVVYGAAWRCQFSGCGKDLHTHLATNQSGRFSYFAHIVASSPDGPRGDRVQSPLLANDPENFLLLCDGCHRLIDKINPAKYTVHDLQEMRRNSISEVRRLLDTLQYDEVEVFAILGNVTGQPPQVSMREVSEALWENKLRAKKSTYETYFFNGGLQHNPHAADYWGSLFRVLKSDVIRLQSVLNGTSQGGAPRPKIAVLALHSTSVLILAGRILGDHAGTHLLQSHRCSTAPAVTRWGWPSNVEAPEENKFSWRFLKEKSETTDEACLLISLTAACELGRLPPSCVKDGQLSIPTIEVSVLAPSIHAISHPRDLQLLSKQLDGVMKQVQDVWKAKRVHLISIAPASANVLVGQKMQARNQATYICHESLGGNQAPFEPTIQIESKFVRELITNQEIPLQN